MAKSFQCQDAGVVCNAKVVGDSEDSVITQAVAHARDAHGVDLGQSSTLTGYVRSLIRDEPGSADAR